VKAFVTGATGFVGLNLIEELARRGWQVVALHRPQSDLSYLARLPAERVVGDITDAASVRSAMPERVDAVFHVAGNTSLWSRRNAAQTRENVDGTRNVVAAALARSAGTLVATSSVAAFGILHGEVTEATPQKGGESWINYQRSKFLAEEEVRKGVRAGLRATIMNPGAIIGPYDVSGWARLIRLVASDQLPGVLPGQVSAAHVREVANAHIAAAERGRPGENYILAGTKTSFLEMCAIIAELAGKKAPTRVLPLPVLHVIARLQVIAAALGAKPPQITPETVSGLSRQCTFVSTKAERELGFKIVSIRDMLKDSYDWLVAEGRIAPRT
jgi:nucleoside-diphosphate-sugar epimerase